MSELAFLIIGLVNTLSSKSCHPVTEGGRYRDPNPHSRPSSGSPEEERTEILSAKEVKIIMGKSIEMAEPSSWEFTNSRLTMIELAWELTRHSVCCCVTWFV